MSADWLRRMPAMAHGLPVCPPARSDMPIPEGYDKPVPLVDPYEAYAFTSFMRTNADGTISYALPCDERHDNGRGVVHGGLLMTFADSALAYAAWGSLPTGSWCVTVSQNSSFLRGVRVGDLVEVTPIITRKTRSVIFTKGEFTVRGEAVFAATSIWKVTGRETRKPD